MSRRWSASEDTSRDRRRRAPLALLGAWLSGAWLLSALLLALTAAPALADEPTATVPTATGPVATGLAATADRLLRVVRLQDYNTRVVLAGATLLGLTAGVVGVLMLLRKRSLVGDVVGHAALPGVGVAFLVLEAVSPGAGRWLPGLLVGAFLAGLAGVGCLTAIRRYSRIKEDAALALVLSVFFGVGVALFTVIQNVPGGNAAGLRYFIYGKAASLVADDVRIIAVAAVVVLAVAALLFKELTLLAFDARFAATQGWPVLRLDLVLMTLVVGVTVIGLQAVGLLLVVALLITPAAAARFWTDRLGPLTAIAGLLGAASAAVGVVVSASAPRLAAGAVIVLVGAAAFLLSLVLGSRRGLWRMWVTRRRLERRVGRQDLLRAAYECLEPSIRGHANGDTLDLTAFDAPLADIAARRAWSPGRLARLIAREQRAGLVRRRGADALRLTPSGVELALQATRNHRLWELYLIAHADIAPSHVDRDADQIEHLLEPELLAQLETVMLAEHPEMLTPPSPHQLPSVAGEGAP